MIYFLRSPETGLVKIGTTENIHVRMSQLIYEYGDLELLGVMDGSRQDEQALHSRFAEYRAPDAKGVEWFYLSDEVSEFIDVNTSLNLPPAEHIISLRVKDRTRVALEVFRAMQVVKTGATLSVDDAILLAIELANPEATRRAEELTKGQTKKK